MKTIKGPGLFLGQFAGDAAPFNSWDAITKWAADIGYKGVQVPTWAGQLIDLKKAASSKDYCDEFAGKARRKRHRDHRAFHPPARPAGGRASSL